MGYSSICAKGAEIAQLSNTPRAQSNETSEPRQVTYAAKPPHISFNVGFEIISKCLSRVEILIENPRIEPGEQDIVHLIAGTRSLPLSQREGKKTQ